MRVRALGVLPVLVASAALAGCGAGTGALPPAATTTAAATATTVAATLTSASDLAACNVLETKIRLVSELVAASVYQVTHSLHPKQLARRTGAAAENLRFAAGVLASIGAPASLVPARNRLVAGLRRFAADFERAQRSVERNDLPAAARELADPPALARLTAAARTIDTACGA
jgi:hypothetical protein